MKRILVIEDELNLRNTLSDLLEMFEYEVIMAENGQEGLEKAMYENPDLIICDINMPKMNGFEVLENLKKRMPTKILPPFIYLTAKIARSDIRKGMKMGAEDYITKPFSNHEILDVVEAKLKTRNQLKTNISDNERLRISSELHDELQPYIVAAKMGLDKIYKTAELSIEEKHIFKNSLQYVDQAIASSRTIAHQLVVKESEKRIELIAFLEELKQRIVISGEIDCSVSYSLKDVLPEEQEYHLILIIQELVTNILKHAYASHIIISIGGTTENKIQATIQDDGNGFDEKVTKKGFGLNNISKRVSQLKGHIHIDSQIAKGTKTTIIFPKTLNK